jgi:hypothetical protein
MSKTITKAIGEGDARGELYAALAYSATDKFQGVKIKSLMLNGDERIYFRDSTAYIYSDAAGSLIIAATTVSITGTVVPNYDAGFLMTSTNRISFYDTDMYIYASANGTLALVSDTNLTMAATTITLTGAITVTGAPTITGNVSITGTVAIDGAVTMATTDKIQFHDSGASIQASAQNTLALAATAVTITAATDHTGVFEMQTTSKIQFHDSGASIQASAQNTLALAATTAITVGATDIGLTGAIAITGALAMSDAITMATTKKINFHDTGATIQASSQNTLALAATTAISLTATTITVAGATNHTGALEMQTTSRLQFHDTGMYIYASADAALAIVGDTALAITCPTTTVTATTLIDLVGVTKINKDTEASAVGTASIYTTGGLGVAKKLYLGTDLVMVAGDIDMSTAGTGTYDIIVKDDVADALSIRDDAADFMVITTTTGSDLVSFTPNVYFTAALTSTGRMYPKSTVTSKTSGATVTYTAAEVLNSMIIDAVTEACAATTHTGTQLIAAIPNCVDGSSFWFILENGAAGAFAITLTAGVDVTVTGTATVAQNNTKLFFGIVTSVSSHTVTIYSVGTMVT